MAQCSSNNGGTDQVLVEETGSVRTFILNRPNQLNALSFRMISRLTELFYASEEDPNVKMIILKGHRRAFCAGGDVSIFFQNPGNWKIGANFLQKQYTLNYVMATYSKTQVSILNGIVMGGGAGASIHGRFRVATEKSVFAMPETDLGHFPDVGASYFLSRLPGFFGEYAGLTGSRLDGAEMLACGLATHFVSSDIREGRLQDISCCLVREYRMACHLLRGEFSKDVVEGYRAIFIDKDRNPKWEPSRLELISDDDVDRYFSKIDAEDWEDLKLPPRSNMHPYAIAKL
ncbi:3-hydroxyisobutyryl-CoA hydrolase 1-like isoform X4 [Solanum dulcamara]|uniref:3-hydroxyisobutyryl-CoA hydrolase 1-like isoform X4 n=1 Tax=Solanum dulcamara TaxID=45834 RepID=UPI0024865DDB|nr:3-hydroxyisobutyryl-CoA hydrolase 1-like isoform X4 [Solanum dulcamara]